VKTAYAFGLAGAAAVGLYVFRDRFGLGRFFGSANPQGSLTSTSPATTAQSPITRATGATFGRVQQVAAAVKPAPPAGMTQLASPPPPAGSSPGSGIGAKDVASAAAGIAAAAGCNAIPGVGTAASPLCGIAGAALGSKAYDLGSQAVGAIKGWF